MIRDTISEIEAKVKHARSINEQKRHELLSLLASLKSEIARLPETQADRVRSITGFAELSAHEATRDPKDQELLDLSLKGLASSVREFEASHPALVKTVNEISMVLANMGI